MAIKILTIFLFTGTIKELKVQLNAKEEKCTSLLEASHRLYNELAIEKDRNLTLDKKLDVERKAAQTVSKDIQKYVDYAKDLETKLSEERQKSQKLLMVNEKEENVTKEIKLDAERKSAQTAFKDVQKYKDYAKDLETKLAEERQKVQKLRLQVKSEESFQIQKVLTSYSVEDTIWMIKAFVSNV